MKRINNPRFKRVKRNYNGVSRTVYVRNETRQITKEELYSAKILNIDEINENIDKGFISKRDWQGLSILNYTPQTQITREWNPSTLLCRGLIVDDSWNIIARPFPKFFNLNEHEDQKRFFDNDFICSEKMDGSLGIIFRHPETNKIHVSTRGSMQSDQALWATTWINQNPIIDFDDNVTPLVEIIYPENRIVVNYGDDKKLVLLDVIDKQSGNDSPDFEWSGEKARTFKIDNISELLESGPLEDNGNNEGYVLKFNIDNRIERVKVKLTEYIKLHKIVFGLNSRQIWEHVSTGNSLDEIMNVVPDELYEWIKNTSSGLLETKQSIEEEAKESYIRIVDSLDDEFTRKDFAKIAGKSKYPNLLFILLDNNGEFSERSDQTIWKMLKPEHETPFS